MTLSNRPNLRNLSHKPAARYAVLLVGLGAAGVAIGWMGPDLTRRR